MGCCVVVPNEAHDGSTVHIIMHEAGQECHFFDWVNVCLGFPVWVGVSEPGKIISGKPEDCAVQVVK